MKPQKSGSKYLSHIKKYFCIAALFCGAAIVFSGCEAEVEKIEAFSSPESLPVVYAENFETTFIDSFKIRTYMKAPVLQEFKTEKQSFFEFPEGVILIKYDETGKVISRIQADYARNYEKEKKWEAKNNVVAVNSLGDTLKTEYLVTEEETGKIYSDKFVKIIRPDQIITGIGFEADQNMENWKIKDPKGTIYITVDEGEQNQNDSVSVNDNSLKPVQFSK
ncbi:MAG: LPS export ABC transporter periplasmic protein LptC [Prolixibacteraceae bacterium]|nr:LPS export ABC transporter periplasmic protein LptC [Prolixibacteraceae bacterium]MBN2773067.1 LPS export ABC transporter periplasmic protein LptC [Prolixibacteraceae bacterium]